MKILAYHGTDVEFENFDASFKNKNNYSELGVGFYFDTELSNAQDYGNIIITAQIEVNNPYTNTKEQFNKLASILGGDKVNHEPTIEEFIDLIYYDKHDIEFFLNKLGFDSILIHTQLVVFDTSNIKILNKTKVYECNKELQTQKDNDMNIPQLLEKLKKIIIEPQEVLLDEMEDETGMNKVEECMMAAVTPPSIGPAPTPAFSQVKVANKPVEGKSKKKNKVKECNTNCDVLNELTTMLEEINTSIDDVIIAWLDRLHFKNLKSDSGFIYKHNGGNFLHYIIFNKPNKIKYIVKNLDNQTLFSDEWQVRDPEDTDDLFKSTIAKKFDSYE